MGFQKWPFYKENTLQNSVFDPKKPYGGLSRVKCIQTRRGVLKESASDDTLPVRILLNAYIFMTFWNSDSQFKSCRHHQWADIKWNKNLGTCRTCNQLEYDRTAIEENCKFQKNGMQLCRFTCRNDKPIYPLERNIIFAQVSDSNYLTHQKPSETLFI